MPEASDYLVTRDGARIAVRECGPLHGPLVVLVPGWPQTLHAWRHVQARLEEAGIRSIALDPPGLGASDIPGRREDYATPNIAALMADAVSSMNVGPYTLVGHDVGAWIAYAWASTRPETVMRLALVDAAIPGALPPSFPIASASKVFQFFFNAVADLPEGLTQGREQVYLDWLFRSKSTVKEAIGPEDLAVYMRCYGDPARMSAGFDYYRAVSMSQEALSDAATLTMPVLAIGGEFGVGDTLGKALAPHCADLTTEVIEGSGHYVPEEKHAELSARLIAYLEGEKS